MGSGDESEPEDAFERSNKMIPPAAIDQVEHDAKQFNGRKEAEGDRC